MIKTGWGVPLGFFGTRFASDIVEGSLYRVEAPIYRRRLRFSYDPAPAARTVGRFAPSAEAKSASTSGAPTPSCFERAASAFLIDSRMHVASMRVFQVLCRCQVVGRMSFRRLRLGRFPCLFLVRLASFRSLS
ncbi:hypothetical protein SAMN04488168_12650 [Bacillus sp. 491mf]|nr:hypothetical protein SAMN04488168_12650 [Bacillus sp. 491mf]